MRRNNKGGRLLAALLVLIMLLCSFPMVYAADTAAVNTVADREYNPEAGMESVMIAAEPAATPETDPADVPEEESAETSEPAGIPEEEPAEVPEPADVPEEEPAEVPEPADIPEEEPAAEVNPAEIPEEETEKDSGPEAEPETEADPGEEASEDTLYEFDDDEVGSVSGELLEIFNNPDTYERIEFTGSVDIELKSSEICYDRDVTLVARVSGADMDYRLVWEANDGSGWFAVASGDEYTFLLTPDIVNREYRVVLFRVC